MTPLTDGEYYQQQRFTQLTAPGVVLSSAEFDGCVFERCAFTEATFRRCTFTGCRFIACDLSLVKVPNSVFTAVEFERSNFFGIDWTTAGTSAAMRALLSFNFIDCVLDYSSFFGMNLRGIKITGCHAQEVDFGEADLRDADCSRTDFIASTFLHTNLERAVFTGATNYLIDPNANMIKHATFSLPEALSLLRGFDILIE